MKKLGKVGITVACERNWFGTIRAFVLWVYANFDAGAIAVLVVHHGTHNQAHVGVWIVVLKLIYKFNVLIFCSRS